MMQQSPALLYKSPLIRKKLNFDKFAVGSDKLKRGPGQLKNNNNFHHHHHHSRNINFLNLNDLTTNMQSKTLSSLNYANASARVSQTCSNISSPSHKGDNGCGGGGGGRTNRIIQWKTPKNQISKWESTSKANSFVNSFNFSKKLSSIKCFMIRKLYVMWRSSKSQKDIIKSMRQLMRMETNQKVTFQYNNRSQARSSPYKDMYISKSSIMTLYNKSYRPDSPPPNSRGATESSYYKFHRTTLNQSTQQRPNKGRVKTPQQITQSKGGFNFVSPQHNTSVHLQKVVSICLCYDQIILQFGSRSPTRGKKQSQAMHNKKNKSSLIISHNTDTHNKQSYNRIRNTSRSPRKLTRQSSISNSPVRSRPQQIRCQFTTSMQGIAGFS